MESEVESNLFNETVRIFNGAVALGFADAVQAGAPMPDTEFQKALAENVEVFSAFRTHRMQNDIARLMTDERGVLKSFSRFARDVQPYVSHRNRAWLRTEYSTAVLRAAQASEWKQFEAEKDVLPNLRWVPSTSPDPGADHRVFWNTVRPIGDRFWSQHRPGDRWNCKCDLEPTDEPSTAVPSVSGKRDEPSPGLENNPGKDGKIFSRKHPYFPKSCAACPFNPQPKLFALFADLAAQKDCNECARMERSIRSTERHYYMEQMESLLDKRINKNVNGKEITVGFTKYGNKHLFSDTFSRSREFRKEDLPTVDRMLERSEFVKIGELSKERKDNIRRFYYFRTELRGNDVYLNVAETDEASKSGEIWHKRFLYSITDNIK